MNQKIHIVVEFASIQIIKIKQFRDNINIDKEFRDKLENCLQSNKKRIEFGLSCLQLSSPTSQLELLKELNDNLGTYSFTDVVKYSIVSVFALKCLEKYGQRLIALHRVNYRSFPGLDYKLVVCCDINISQNWLFNYLVYDNYTLLLPNFDVLSPYERQFYIKNFDSIASNFYKFIKYWLS